MRIDWTPPVRRSQGRRDDKPEAGGEARFSTALAGETAPPPPTATPAAGPVDGLLALQEIPDALAGRRRAMQRGSTLLDRLDELRLGLLAGVLPRERLHELARAARTAREAVDDSGLSLILDDIDLRVAVELAKLDQAP